MRWVTTDGRTAGNRRPRRERTSGQNNQIERVVHADQASDAPETSAVTPSSSAPPASGTPAVRSTRTLALGSMVATGLLTATVAASPASAQQPDAVAPTESVAQRSFWHADDAVAGELAGRASRSSQLLLLFGETDAAKVRPSTMVRTVELLQHAAWQQTRRLAPVRPVLASRPAAPVGQASVTAHGAVLAARFSDPVAFMAEPAQWRAVEQVELAASLADAQARAEAEAVARAAASALAAARAEADRVAAEAAAQAQAQAQAAEAARLETERIAAEQIQQEADAQRRPEPGDRSPIEPSDQSAPDEPAPQVPSTTAAAPQPSAAAPPQPQPTPAPTVAPSTTTTAAPVLAPAAVNDIEALESTFFALINQERAAVGLPALSFDANLRASARSQAARINAAGSLFHQDLGGVLALGWRTAGENVGYGPTSDRLHAAFVASAGHYRNMVNPAFTSLGVGVFVGADGQIWVAHVFGG